MAQNEKKMTSYLDLQAILFTLDKSLLLLNHLFGITAAEVRTQAMVGNKTLNRTLFLTP